MQYNFSKRALQAAVGHDNDVTTLLLSLTNETKDAAACAHCESIPKSEGGHAPSQGRHEVHCQENVPAGQTVARAELEPPRWTNVSWTKLPVISLRIIIYSDPYQILPLEAECIALEVKAGVGSAYL